MGKATLYAGIALMVAAIVAGCGGGKGESNSATSGGRAGSSVSYPELRWGLTTFPGPLDWNKNPWNQLIAIEQLAVQNLVEFEPDGTIKPTLASSVEQPNSTTYIYHLRSGVKFSDGKPLTAADVVYSLRRNMVGKEVFTKTYWEDVASVTSNGGSTIIVKLKRPSAVFQDVMAFTGQITEKQQIEKIGEKALGTPGNLPIGTGPWKLDNYQPEATVQLSRNPYWKGAPRAAAKVIVSLFKTEASLALALRSGAIDGTFNYVAPKIFANIPGTRRLNAPGTVAVIAGVNTTAPPFNDVHVRRAVAYATNVKGMIDAVYPGGTAIEDATIAPASLFSHLGTTTQVSGMLSALPKYKYSLAAARRELAKSKYPHGFTTTIQVEVIEANLILDAQILAADLAKIGIHAKVHEVQPDEAVSEIMTGSKVKLQLTYYYSAYADPEGIMSSILPPSQIAPPGSGLNVASYNDAEVNKLQREEVETLKPAKRLQLIGKLLRIVGADAPYWPLYTYAMLGTLSEKYVFPSFSAWTAFYKPWALDVKLAQ